LANDEKERDMRRTTTIAACIAALALVAAASAVAPAITPGTIAGAKLGLGAAAYQKLLGTPVHLDVPPKGFEQPDSYTRLVFPKRKLYVYFSDDIDKATLITTWNKKYRTAAGIGPCSTVAQLKTAYGSKLKPSKWSTQNGNTYVYLVGDLLFAAADLTHVTAVGLYNSKAPGANKEGGALPFAGFIIQAPDQTPCS
jgi:hypothetical protein